MKYVYDACVPHVVLAAVFFYGLLREGAWETDREGGEALVRMPVRPSAVHCCIPPASGPLLLLLLLLLLRLAHRRLGITGTVICSVFPRISILCRFNFSTDVCPRFGESCEVMVW